jgi:hypothetical protein
MMQVIETTHSEKVEMYQMVEKDKLIEMLIEANNVINRLTEAKNLRIADVSCQREQLLAFAGWLYGNLDKEVERMIVDDYLKGK